ncbi:hypothetical protein LX64_05015 [Chitinophaga skermanii]|uniref:Uncharacterized protein n=1 Tax=Chitinophaga skermanii TaxID=331697 RepID=A0A327Q1W6_9BACT|nr:hypothetical protein [Chitinophaga skermanii]RAI97711.1 hypothetical protein LX64_05015 [Chitinophaga skermanii]
MDRRALTFAILSTLGIISSVFAWIKFTGSLLGVSMNSMPGVNGYDTDSGKINALCCLAMLVVSVIPAITFNTKRVIFILGSVINMAAVGYYIYSFKTLDGSVELIKIATAMMDLSIMPYAAFLIAMGGFLYALMVGADYDSEDEPTYA